VNYPEHLGKNLYTTVIHRVRTINKASTQLIENRGAVVCVGSSTAPDSVRFIGGGLGCTVQPVRPVTDLGIHLDADLPMRMRVTRTASSCFVVPRQIRSIDGPSVDRSLTVQSLIVSLRLSGVDYGGATYASMPSSSSV